MVKIATKFKYVLTLIFVILTSSVLKAQPLSGSYTVDTTGQGDFSSIAAAANALNNRGVNGPVTININPGLYNERVQIDSIVGTSQQNTVTFQSSTQNSSDVKVFQKGSRDTLIPFSLLKTDHVIFKDLNVSVITNTGGTGEYRYPFKVRQGVSHLIIKDCRISAELGKGIYMFNYSILTNSKIQHLTFKNNVFPEGGIEVDAYFDYGLSDVTIANNKFYGENSITILGGSNISISNNYLRNLNGNTALEFYNMDGITIKGNKIIGYNDGIFITMTQIQDKKALIANNFISCQQTGIAFGISSFSLLGEIYYNSVLVTRGQGFNSRVIDYSENGIYKNNIFVNKGGGPVVRIHDTASGIISDHNDFYTSGSTFAIVKETSFNNYDSIKDFASFKQKYNSDQNSLNIDPLFASDTNLHINNPALKEKGTPISGITTDIDGETRDLQTPDIGADEVQAVPDLICNSASINPQNIESDGSFKTNWSVKNKGNASVQGPWMDGIYLSRNNSLDTAKDHLIAAKNINITLDPGNSYSQQLGMQFPFIDSSGTFYVIVKPNYNSEAIENTSNNNYVISSALNVTLSDRADLKITNIQEPNGINSGEKLKFSYTVKNTGNEQTKGSWQDAFFIGADSSAMAASVIPGDTLTLIEKKNAAPVSLKPGQIYQATVSVKFPLRISGDYYIKGMTDFNDDLIEKNEKSANTHFSNVINVAQTPLPNLTVTNVSLNPRYFSGEFAQISYQIKNEGSRDVLIDRWSDKLWLLNVHSDEKYKLGTTERRDSLKQGNVLQVYDSFRMPDCEADTFRLQITTDYLGNIKELTEANSTLSDTFELVLRPQPDLMVPSVSWLKPSPTTEQNNVKASITVKNDGNTDYEFGVEGVIYNALYLSKDQNLNFNEDRFLRLKLLQEDIPSGQSIKDTLAFSIPPDVPGDYYLYAYTDKKDLVCEIPFEDNNSNRTASTTIQLAPPKDLAPTSLGFDAKDRKTGDQVLVSAKIENQKSGKIDHRLWRDDIYLISANHQDTFTVRTIRHTRSLLGNAQYSVNQTFNVPVRIPTGDYYLSLITDIEDDVYEHQAEANNALNSGTFRITRDPNAVSDVVAKSIMVTNNPKSGEKLKFNYTTRNASDNATFENGWLNKVALVNESNQVVAEKGFLHFGKLSGQESKQASSSIRVPEGKSGNYRVLIDLDTTNKVYEYNESNNMKSTSVQISLSPWADLDPNITNFTTNVRSGQRMPIAYSIQNKGNGSIDKANWIDRIYLSRDEILDENDTKIITVRHSNQNLSSSNSFSVNTDTILPKTLDGYYYVIVESDVGNQIYEHPNTSNNIAISNSQVNVTKALPADLEVNNITIKNREDKQVTFEVQVINHGPNQVKGDWSYSTILSNDQTLDVSDNWRNNLSPLNQINTGGAQSFDITFEYPMVKPGYYHLFLKLDNLNQIPETDENNNTYRIRDSFHVNLIDTLHVDKTKQDRYRNNFHESDPIYYQMPVGKDTGIYLRLEPDNQNISTELFTKTGDVPGRLNYDHRHNNPGQAEQNIIIPSQDTNRTDYIMTSSNYIPHTNAYAPFSILAESKTFSIQRVYPENGSNKGMVVVDIDGFDFTDKTKFYLINQSQTDTIKPIQQYNLSSVKGRAHFDLRGHAAGEYDVYAIKQSGARTKLEKGFKVLSKGLTDLTVSVTTPGRRLVGDKAYPKVYFGNHGEINAYDVSLTVLFYTENLNTDNLNVRFNGSDAQYDEDEINLNPAGRYNIGDTLGIKFYSVYLPLMPSGATSSLTFEMTSEKESNVHVKAFWTHYPKTDWAFTGDIDELASSRFLQKTDSFLSRAIGKLDPASLNKNGGLNNCSQDLNIKNMERQVLNELKNQVMGIGGVTPKVTAKANLIKMASKGALSKLGISKGDEIAKFGKKVYEKSQDAKTWKKRATDPHYSKELKFVFKCIRQDKNFQEKLKKESCIEEYTLENTYYGDITRTRNVCNNNGGSGGNDGNGITEFVESLDPNEIIGPSGVTELKLVKPDKTLQYDILFENKSTATSPAQEVKITNPLPPEADIKSFRLGKLGFGDTVIQLPNQQTVNKQYEFGSGLNEYVLKVTAGIDPINREAFWTISTIDPETGRPPKDPSNGFLPPNDSTGQGEGFVSYTINAKENLNHGDSIDNRATIIFDDNPAIETNTWTNIVSNDVLQSKVLDNYNHVDSTSVILEWKQIGKKPFSTQAENYNIYMSENDSIYTKWLRNTPEQKARFNGKAGETYYFKSQAIGPNGGIEPFKDTYDVKVTLESATGMEEEPGDTIKAFNSRKGLQVYPNPAKSHINAEFTLNKSQKVRLQVTNLQGQVLSTLTNSELMAGTHEFTFSPKGKGLNEGVYFMILKGEERTNVEKWIYVE